MIDPTFDHVKWDPVNDAEQQLTLEQWQQLMHYLIDEFVAHTKETIKFQNEPEMTEMKHEWTNHFIGWGSW